MVELLIEFRCHKLTPPAAVLRHAVGQNPEVKSSLESPHVDPDAIVGATAFDAFIEYDTTSGWCPYRGRS